MESIFESLKKQINVEIIWVTYMPNKLKTTYSKSGMKIIDIHDYTNALEILKKEKPDVIFAWATHNFIDYAFSLAGKKMNIPVVSGFTRTVSQAHSTFQSNLSMLLESSVPTDTIVEKQFMKRGRFFLFKYGFLLNTQIAIKMKKFEIIKDFFILMKIYLSNPIGLPIYSKFENTLHWLAGEDLIKSLTDAGLDDKILCIIDGNVKMSLHSRASPLFNISSSIEAKFTIITGFFAIKDSDKTDEPEKDTRTSELSR